VNLPARIISAGQPLQEAGDPADLNDVNNTARTDCHMARLNPDELRARARARRRRKSYLVHF
jgi:hypothetical protein